jgi:uncharacterized membrane protein
METLILYASLTGMVRLIGIILLIYFIYNLIMRLIVPNIIKNQLNNLQQQFNNQNQPASNQKKGKEGDISIEFVNREKEPVTKHDMGEYVDYEEIK